MDTEGLRARTNVINKWFDKKGKYRHPEYDDKEIEGMMRYFHLHSYSDLLQLLKNMRKD